MKKTMTYDIGNPGPVLVQYTLYIINMVSFCRRYYCCHILATTNYSRHIEDRPTTRYHKLVDTLRTDRLLATTNYSRHI